MRNYLKVPVESDLKSIINLINQNMSTHPDWDKVSQVKDITFHDQSMDFKFTTIDGSELTDLEKENTAKVILDLGFVYEYNFS